MMVAAREEDPEVNTPAPPRPPAVPTMPHEAQLDAAVAFVSALEDMVPNAVFDGADYLACRGCFFCEDWLDNPPNPPRAWWLPADARQPLALQLASGPEADLLARAGLLKPAAHGKPPRLPWWGRVVLLGCHDAAGNLAYFVGHRHDWTEGDRWGKYINQGTAGGAVRWPFNLPSLYHAAGRLSRKGKDTWPVEPAPERAGDVLLVEGPLNALAAECLGWPAVALLTRLQAHDYAARDGAAVRMLEAHLPALRDVRRVRVVPDADPGLKGGEGEALAARLVGWLRFAGVRADVTRLFDLCPDAPEGCKDLVDVSEARDRATLEAWEVSRKERHDRRTRQV